MSAAPPHPPIGRRAVALVAALSTLGGAVFGGLGAALAMRRTHRKRRGQNFMYWIENDCAALGAAVGKTRAHIDLQNEAERVQREREAKKRKLLANPGIISHTGFTEEFVRDRFQLFDCADGMPAVLLKPGKPLVLDADCRLFIKGRFAVCCDVIVKEGAQLGFEQMYKIRSFRGSTFDPTASVLFAGESARWMRGNVVKNDNSCLEFGAMPAFETEQVQQADVQVCNYRFDTVPMPRLYANPFGCCSITTLVQGGLVITHWQPEVDGVECWTGGLVMHPVMHMHTDAEHPAQQETTTASPTALPHTTQPLATVSEVSSDSEQGEDAEIRAPSSPHVFASDSASLESDTASGSSLTPTTATSEDTQTSDAEEGSVDQALDQMISHVVDSAVEQTSPHTPSTPHTPHKPLASDTVAQTKHVTEADVLVPLMSGE